MSSGPARLLPERRFLTGDTTAGDRHISRPAHEPEVLVPQRHARSAGSAPPLARCGRSTHRPALHEHAGSPESETGCARAPPIRLLPTCVALRRSPGTPLASAGGFVLPEAGVQAAGAAPIAPPLPRLRPFPASPQRSLLRSLAALPAAVPVVRSADPAFPTSGRTACGGAWRSAALTARSHYRERRSVYAARRSRLSVRWDSGLRGWEERQPRYSLQENIPQLFYSGIKIAPKR